MYIHQGDTKMLHQNTDFKHWCTNQSFFLQCFLGQMTCSPESPHGVGYNGWLEYKNGHPCALLSLQVVSVNSIITIVSIII